MPPRKTPTLKELRIAVELLLNEAARCDEAACRTRVQISRLACAEEARACRVAAAILNSLVNP